MLNFVGLIKFTRADRKAAESTLIWVIGTPAGQLVVESAVLTDAQSDSFTVGEWSPPGETCLEH